MDKILKEFGIERLPLVDMNESKTVQVMEEGYEVVTYSNETKVDMFEFMHHDHNNHILNHSVKANESELLDGIKPFINTYINSMGGYKIVRSTINLARKK